MPSPVHVLFVGNVGAGKSTVFNRLTGADTAVASGGAGVTVDFLARKSIHSPDDVVYIDTPGSADFGFDARDRASVQVISALERYPVNGICIFTRFGRNGAILDDIKKIVPALCDQPIMVAVTHTDLATTPGECSDVIASVTDALRTNSRVRLVDAIAIGKGDSDEDVRARFDSVSLKFRGEYVVVTKTLRTNIRNMSKLDVMRVELDNMVEPLRPMINDACSRLEAACKGDHSAWLLSMLCMVTLRLINRAWHIVLMKKLQLATTMVYDSVLPSVLEDAVECCQRVKQMLGGDCMLHTSVDTPTVAFAQLAACDLVPQSMDAVLRCAKYIVATRHDSSVHGNSWSAPIRCHDVTALDAMDPCLQKLALMCMAMVPPDHWGRMLERLAEKHTLQYSAIMEVLVHRRCVAKVASVYLCLARDPPCQATFKRTPGADYMRLELGDWRSLHATDVRPFGFSVQVMLNETPSDHVHTPPCMCLMFTHEFHNVHASVYPASVTCERCNALLSQLIP